MIETQTRWSTVSRTEFIFILNGACKTVQDFMTYSPNVNDMRQSYRKIAHIKTIKNLLNTDLMTAKQAVDLAIKLWDNEHPKPDLDDELKALREKLTGSPDPLTTPF